jgi:hypothetical protein
MDGGKCQGIYNKSTNTPLSVQDALLSGRNLIIESK